jgi:hypothetical protein
MLFSVLVDFRKRGVRFVAGHAILRPVACEKNGRLQPEFALSVRRPDMDMRRLASLVGLEVKTETSDAQDCRHGFNLPCATLQGNIFCQRPRSSMPVRLRRT